VRIKVRSLNLISACGRRYDLKIVDMKINPASGDFQKSVSPGVI